MELKGKCIIAFSHSNYLIKSAGVEKFIEEESIVLKENDIHFIQVFPIIECNKLLYKFGLNIQYVGINIDNKFAGIIEIDKLVSYILKIAHNNHFLLEGIQIHHLHGWNIKKMISIIKELELPVKLYIHDYDTVSPYIMCTDVLPKFKYNILVVSSPEYKKCKYYKKGYDHYLSIKAFLNSITKYIVQVYVPSENTLKIWSRYFPEFKDKVSIRPHLTFTNIKNSRIPNKILRIAYIGSTAEHKGFNQWKKLVNQLYDLGFDFYYFGNSNYQDARIKKVNVDFHNKKLPSMTAQLKRNNIDIVFMWSECQETYAYTLYEAVAAGCFILTNDHSGNITTEVEQNKYGKVFTHFEDCLKYLNEGNVILDVEKYVENIKIPKTLEVNRDLQSLTFKNVLKEHKKLKKYHPNYFLTFLYWLLRVKNEY